MKVDKISIFKYTFPLIMAGMAEQLLLLTDVLLLSFKDEIYLATIGLIDAFLLCSLAYGFSLNDSFQNFYSRNSENKSLGISTYKKSVPLFIKHAVVITIISATLAYCLNIFYTNDTYQLFLNNIPLLIPLILLNYCSMSMNAFIVGQGMIKTIGLISISCVVMNFSLGYYCLYFMDTEISPLVIILCTSILSEILGIVLMSFIINKSITEGYNSLSTNNRLLKTIKRASYYPAFSEILFHLGSFVLFLFCSTYFEVKEVALLSMILSYWGVLLIPTEAFSETALNYFSAIYSKNKIELFPSVKNNIIGTSLIITAIVALVLYTIDYFLFGIDYAKLIYSLVLILIVFVATFNEILSIALIVRLKNRLFAISKTIYGCVAITSILLLVFTWKNQTISILISLLLAQIVMLVFLNSITKKFWNKLKHY